MKRWEPLEIGDAGIYQDTELGCFTEDSVRLCHFMRVKKTDRVLDIGTGNGILCLYGRALYGGSYTGVDFRADQIALARMSAERNGMTDVHFVEVGADDAPSRFSHGSFDICVMNPPYFTAGDPSPVASRAVSRHAESTLLDTFLHTAFLLLKNGGKLFVCYPADALCDIMCAARHNRLEPKRICTVMSGGKARLLLIEAKKLAKAGLCMDFSE